MKWSPRFLRRLLAPLTWNRRDQEMDSELAFHVDAIVQDFVRSGMTRQDAERAARKRFGSVPRIKEQGHEVIGARFVDDLLRDVRHVTRGLRRSPGFTAAVVLTLALGIGGNTAIFSVVDQVLLRPLPYPNADQLVRIYETFPPAPRNNVASPANWLDWQREARTLQSLAAWRSNPVTLTGTGDPIRLNAEIVSWEFFPVLGVKPLLGRTVAEDDDRPDAPLVAVMSYSLWQRRFAGNPSVIGKVVLLNDRATEIIGVMPPSFQFPQPDDDLWGNYRIDRTVPYRERSGRFINVVARVRDGSTVAAVRAEMLGVARRLAETYAFNKNTSVAVVPLREDLTAQVQSSVMVLYAAVGVLLSIACFNVANLLLARGASRRREIAIRASLGAGQSAIVRQLLVESLLLATVGGILGVVLARWTLSAMMAFVPGDVLRTAVLVDSRVLMYALALTVATGIAVGLVPAWLIVRHSAAAQLRGGGRTTTHASRVRQGLVVAQVALTVLLLCGAGLLVRTLVALSQTGNGLDKHGVLTLQVQLPATRYNAERTQRFFRDAVAALRVLPGVESAAAANSLAVIGDPRGGTAFHLTGTPPIPIVNGQPLFDGAPMATIRVVTPEYFKTMRIPVLRGREFTESDSLSSAPGFLVNEALVKTFLANRDPLAASMSVWMARENPEAPVLGVVGDVSEGSLRGKAQPTIFYSHRQLSETGMTLFVRSDRPAGLAATAVAAIHTLDPNLAITKVRTFDDAVVESLARERLSALVSGGFAVTGLLLASLGLYGLLAFVVTERTREIGTRMALGAQAGRVTRSVVGSGLRLVTIGAGLGVGASLLAFRLLDTLLFGVTPYDPSTYASVLGLLTAVAMLASYIPARRAAQVQPLVALRQE